MILIVKLMLLPALFCYSIYIVEKNPVPKSQTKPFYIGTKEAPSGSGEEDF